MLVGATARAACRTGNHPRSRFLRACTADPPHKRPTFAVDSLVSWIYVLSISTGRRDVSLSSSLLVLRHRVGCGGRKIVGDNSQFGVFNSWLGRREFPVRSATGIHWQRLDLPDVFAAKRGLRSGKPTKFPVFRENGNFARRREICYFTSARKLGVGSAPMSACLDAFAATFGVPPPAPWIAGTWRVTCAVY